MGVRKIVRGAKMPGRRDDRTVEKILRDEAVPSLVRVKAMSVVKAEGQQGMDRQRGGQGRGQQGMDRQRGGQGRGQQGMDRQRGGQGRGQQGMDRQRGGGQRGGKSRRR